MGKDEPRLSLRLDLYNGKYENADITEITETPFERFFLAKMGVFDENKITMKFQGEIWTVAELFRYLEDNNLSVSGSGAIYQTEKQALIPSYLEYLFIERKRVKKKMLFAYHNKVMLEKIKIACKEDGIY